MRLELTSFSVNSRARSPGVLDHNVWLSRLDSNQRPPDYQSGALPTELHDNVWRPRRESNPHWTDRQSGALPVCHKAVNLAEAVRIELTRPRRANCFQDSIRRQPSDGTSNGGNSWIRTKGPFLAYELATRCITTLPSFLNWCIQMESNHHSRRRPVYSRVGSPLAQ